MGLNSGWMKLFLLVAGMVVVGFGLGWAIVAKISRPIVPIVPSQKPLESNENKLIKNKLIAGKEEDVLMNDDFAVRAYFLKVDQGKIYLDSLHEETATANLTDQTIYNCQGRFFTGSDGLRTDSLKIYIDYSKRRAIDPTKENAEKLGQKGLAAFLKETEPGNAVVVQTERDSLGNKKALMVTLVSEGSCPF